MGERTETELQSAILRVLNSLPGVFAWRTNSRVLRLPGKGGRERLVRFGGMKGMADIIGWYQQSFGPVTQAAIFLAIEVKRPGRALTLEQSLFLSQVTKAGGVAIIAHSVDDVLRELQR